MTVHVPGLACVTGLESTAMESESGVGCDRETQRVDEAFRPVGEAHAAGTCEGSPGWGQLGAHEGADDQAVQDFQDQRAFHQQESLNALIDHALDGPPGR